jgi:hypothetical protein
MLDCISNHRLGAKFLNEHRTIFARAEKSVILHFGAAALIG